jgi:transcriptional regulator with XRE-family HTH domain
MGDRTVTVRINRNRLRQVRQEKGLSAIDLQVLTGIPYPRIYYFERGTHIPSNAQKESIAKALGCTVQEVFPAELERTREILSVLRG